MSDQQTVRLTMRASDGDRQQVVDRLRGGLEEGRLSMEEFTDRTDMAFRAVTHGELAPLCADLPAAGPVVTASPAPAARGVSPRAVSPRAGGLAGLPMVLKVLWTTWLVAVSVNVVVWALVSDPAGRLADPWPLWVAGPYGAVLFGLSAAVTLFRRGRPPARGR